MDSGCVICIRLLRLELILLSHLRKFLHHTWVSLDDTAFHISFTGRETFLSGELVGVVHMPLSMPCHGCGTYSSSGLTLLWFTCDSYLWLSSDSAPSRGIYMIISWGASGRVFCDACWGLCFGTTLAWSSGLKGIRLDGWPTHAETQVTRQVYLKQRWKSPCLLFQTSSQGNPNISHALPQWEGRQEEQELRVTYVSALIIYLPWLCFMWICRLSAHLIDTFQLRGVLGFWGFGVLDILVD